MQLRLERGAYYKTVAGYMKDWRPVLSKYKSKLKEVHLLYEVINEKWYTESIMYGINKLSCIPIKLLPISSRKYN